MQKTVVTIKSVEVISKWENDSNYRSLFIFDKLMKDAIQKLGDIQTAYRKGLLIIIYELFASCKTYIIRGRRIQIGTSTASS